MYKMTTLFACTLFASTIFAGIETSKVLEKEELNSSSQNLSIPVPDAELENKWEFAFGDAAPDGSYVLEWIPKGENIDRWSELIQIQYFPLAKEMEGKINAEIFTDHFLAALKKHFPTVQSKIPQKQADSVLLEWSLPTKTDEESEQDEIARIISTPTGLYRVAYTKKVATMAQEERDRWTKILTDAQVE